MAGNCSADFVTVDCDTPGSGDGVTSFDNLQSAINHLHDVVGPEGFHSIEVTGTCSFPRDDDGIPGQDTDPGDGSALWNSFFVQDFANLTIQAPDGQTATLEQPVLTCGVPDRDQGHSLVPVLQVSNSLRVFLRRLNITGGRGVSVSDSRVNFRGDVIVTGSHSNGVGVGGVAGSRFGMGNNPDRGEGGNEVGNNCRAGISVGETSTASTGGDSRIHDNGRFGLFTFNSGRISVGGQTIVEGNAFGGMAVRFNGVGTVTGQAIIRNNGATADPSNFFFRFRSGIHAYFGSSLFIGGPIRNPDTGILDPGPTIENNTRQGVLFDLNSTGSLRNVTIQGNSKQGVKLLHQSVVEFEPENTIVSGNVKKDLKCDDSSLAFGDLSGVGTITTQKCQ